MTSKACQIMDALAAALQGIPGVTTFVLDSARIIAPPDGVTVSLDMDGDPSDRIVSICAVDTTMPVLVTIYCTRIPDDPPNWRILDPFYVAVHQRMMADRTLGNLAINIESVGRSPEAATRACALGCRYSVKYRTRQEDVTQ